MNSPGASAGAFLIVRRRAVDRQVARDLGIHEGTWAMGTGIGRLARASGVTRDDVEELKRAQRER